MDQSKVVSSPWVDAFLSSAHDLFQLTSIHVKSFITLSTHSKWSLPLPRLSHAFDSKIFLHSVHFT